jgi:hypothetical protein
MAEMSGALCRQCTFVYTMISSTCDAVIEDLPVELTPEALLYEVPTSGDVVMPYLDGVAS